MVTSETSTSSAPILNEPLVRKVDISESIRSIPEGSSSKYECQVLGNYMTVYSVVRRINERLGRNQFLFESKDNGATFTITNLGFDNAEVIGS